MKKKEKKRQKIVKIRIYLLHEKENKLILRTMYWILKKSQ